MILRFALLGLLPTTWAFAPQTTTTTFTPRSNIIRQQAIVDPNLIHDLPQHLDTAQSFFSSITLSDATDALVDAVTSATPEPTAAVAAVVDTATTAAPAAADAATTAVANDNGGLGFLAGPIEFLLDTIHGGLVSIGLSADAWGVSIIAMTMLIKIVTYPLTFSQLENTNKMQAFQPQIKEIQAKYASNPEVMNQKMAEFYQTNDFNPLAGCVPTLVQLPVLIGLYRSVLNLAKENKLDEPFLFLPNLEGPTYGADPAHASDWLLKGWVNGVPSLGWEDTTSFLIVPVFLIVSQFISMELMAPKNQEQPAFLKFLPLMIGYFSLNVPAALGVYWVANNIITTALSLQIRGQFDTAAPAVTGGGGGGANVVDVQTSTFTPAPMREKPAGFGATDWGEDEVKPITTMDAEVVETVVEEAAAVPSAADLGVPGRGKKKNRGKKKKKKRN